MVLDPAAEPAVAVALAGVTSPTRDGGRDWSPETIPGARAVEIPSALAAFSWGAGPPVLLVHGWEGASSQLEAFIEPLVHAGLRGVAVDAPAHGDSSGTEFTPAAYGAALLEIQDELGRPAGVVAHSLGSTAVTSALRGGLRPRRLAFLAPVRSYSAEVRRLAADHGLDPARFLHQVGGLLGCPVTDLDLDRYSHGGIPALFCHDVDDHRIPIESTRLIAREWSPGLLVETAGLGHHRLLRAPAVVATVVEHLTCR